MEKKWFLSFFKFETWGVEEEEAETICAKVGNLFGRGGKFAKAENLLEVCRVLVLGGLGRFSLEEVWGLRSISLEDTIFEELVGKLFIA